MDMYSHNYKLHISYMYKLKKKCMEHRYTPCHFRWLYMQVETFHRLCVQASRVHVEDSCHLSIHLLTRKCLHLVTFHYSSSNIASPKVMEIHNIPPQSIDRDSMWKYQTLDCSWNSQLSYVQWETLVGANFHIYSHKAFKRNFCIIIFICACQMLYMMAC